MNKMRQFEDSILDTAILTKKAAKTLISNAGKIIALLVTAITIAVTFTDISFDGIISKNFTSSLLLLLTSSYIIYFSLEDSGEKCGMETDEYLNAKERYDELRNKISGEDIEPLRDFCYTYSERELKFRRSCALLTAGLELNAPDKFLSGTSFGKATDRILKKIINIKPIVLTPKTLLCREKQHLRSELENPEKRKLLSLIIKLIPSTICMAITVSVILTAKNGMSAEDVISSILKLSSLPVIGFKGYCAGYSYSKHSLSLWLETKSNILEDFLKENSQKRSLAK